MNYPNYNANLGFGSNYDDYTQPVYSKNALQQERTRKLLAEQLRLMNSNLKPKQSGMRSLDLKTLFDLYGTLS